MRARRTDAMPADIAGAVEANDRWGGRGRQRRGRCDGRLRRRFWQGRRWRLRRLGDTLAILEVLPRKTAIVGGHAPAAFRTSRTGNGESQDKSKSRSRQKCGSCRNPVAIPEKWAKTSITLLPPLVRQKQVPAYNSSEKAAFFDRNRPIRRFASSGCQRIRRPLESTWNRLKRVLRDAGSLHQ